MHDDLLCVIENGHRTRSKTKKTRNHTKGPGKRVMANAQRDESDQVLQAVKFTDKKVNGLHLDLDEDLQAADCFTDGVVEPDVTRGLQPAGLALQL